MDLYDLICESAFSALKLQDSSTGIMPAGNNGPHGDAETPVRNTSHWLITFSKAFEISGDDRFKHAAQLASSYLLSHHARPMSYSFWHRKNPKKDSCNGLIGQAWTLDALITAAPIIETPQLISVAKEVFLLHPFNFEIGLWQNVSVDGVHLPIHLTFNQQLWFGAIGATLSKYDAEVKDSVERFLETILFHLDIAPNGLIMHSVAMRNFSYKKQIMRWIREPKNKSHNQDIYERSLGYHSFNLYAFAILKECYPNHSIWKSNTIAKSISCIEDKTFIRNLQANKYSFSYNPTGLEIPFVLKTFKPGTIKEQESWLQKQLSDHFDFESNLMGRSPSDPHTLAARLCEAKRLDNLKVS
ncbi:MAG: agl cluster protein AglQ [Leptolyngbya sp.]|nr:MAG: agl cluster protein AglQ [Leptolyngbya sp.]